MLAFTEFVSTMSDHLFTQPSSRGPVTFFGIAGRMLTSLVCGALAACSSLPTAGPSGQEVLQAASSPEPGAANILVIELTDAVVQRVRETSRRATFADAFGRAPAPRHVIGAGDALEISVWEAPPAALFNTNPVFDPRGLSSAGTRMAAMPEQVVGPDGTINMPFAGTIQAAGRTPQEIEEAIARRLKGKANDPQVLVRVIRNSSSTATVVGEVTASTRMPLTARGERLLDALAAAGGTRQPVGKVTVQLTREVNESGRRSARVIALPLDSVITDPAQNVLLQPGDVVTVLHQPNSLMLLGATTRNEELNFEAQGITLAQALARAGGLQDQRANPEAVFIFRFEDQAVVGRTNPARTTADGLVPVIYKANLRDPATFFTAQGFPMRNRDILYVSNAPGAELQKFLNIVSSVVVPTVTLRNLSN